MEKDPVLMLESSLLAALETYSNVHRGSGHFSEATTMLFEKARELVLEHLGLVAKENVVIFCTPYGAAMLRKQLKNGDWRELSSQEPGLALGVRAVAVQREALPEGVPFHAGGGTARLIGPGWVVWARPPDRFEAGTPAIINIIAFAKALELTRATGNNYFPVNEIPGPTVAGLLYQDETEQLSGQELLTALRKGMIGRSTCVPTLTGEVPYVNLDNSASTPALRPVWEAYRRALSLTPERRRETVDEVKKIVAQFLGAPPESYEVFFTSNTTEAVNFAASCLRSGISGNEENIVLSTLLEHSSNDLPWRSFTRRPPIRLPIDREGFFDIRRMEELLQEYNRDGLHGRERIRIVTVSGASNVLGTCNDLKSASEVVRRCGARLFVDAAQLVAHRRIGMEAGGIDGLVFSAHKIYAPFGAGALVIKKGIIEFSGKDTALMRSSGEENAAGIAALGKALLLMQRVGMELVCSEEQKLTALALEGMAKIRGLTVYGMTAPSHPRFADKIGVIPFSLKGIMPDVLAKELALRGIGVRYGCHCAHILVKHILGLPPVLQKFQKFLVTIFPGMKLPGIVRISFGIGNTAEDIDRFLGALADIAENKRSRNRSQKIKSREMMQRFTYKVLKKVFL